jgi:chromosome segregation ATPase
MSDDRTRKFDGQSFEERVLAEFATLNSEFAALNRRLTALEEKVDARLRETRPIWEAMQATLEEIRLQLSEVVRDLFATRARVARLEERERPPAA